MLPIIAVVVIVYCLGPGPANINGIIEKYNNISKQNADLVFKQDRLEQLKKQDEKPQEQAEEKKEAKSGKVIYEVPGQQFSSEASFGVIFENLLANLTNSGVRIRSIEYNYQPSGDKILDANLSGYNACEISFVSVGNYSQFQRFFKNIAKEPYLSNIYEVYIEPYDRDKTILITRFKIRLYTKTI